MVKKYEHCDILMKLRETLLDGEVMTREQLFLRLKELVLTLKSPNIKDVNVKNKWDKRRIEFDLEWKLLSANDLKWLDVEYKKWYTEVILPFLTGDLAMYARDNNFPWI